MADPIKPNNIPQRPNQAAQEAPQDDSGEEAAASKRRYVQIPDKKRQQLLEMLENSNLTIKTIAEQLHINYSTAKHIVKLYKNENRVHALPRRSKLLMTRTESRLPLEGGRTPQTDELVARSLRPFYDPNEATRFLKSPSIAQPPPVSLPVFSRPEPNSSSTQEQPARSEPTALSPTTAFLPTTVLLPKLSTFQAWSQSRQSTLRAEEGFAEVESSLPFNFLMYKTMIQER